MRALVCRSIEPGAPLAVEEVAPPVPAAGEVLIDVKAAAVNFPDVLMLEGRYQFKPPLPFVPGGELSGVVRAVGGGVSDLMPGDRVLATMLSGAFAEQAVAPRERVVPIPPGLDYERAAALMFTYGTAYHALKDRAALAPGETLLVLGAAGGVGLAAVELGLRMGARVIAAASSEEKLDACRSRGAEMTVNYATEDLRERVKALTQGQGVDVALDPVGGGFTELALRSLAWRGRLLVVGFASGEIPKLPANLALLKGASIVGVFWGEFTRRETALSSANMRELVEWAEAGRLEPFVSARYPLARAGEAIAQVRERRARGKVLVLTQE